MKKIVGVCALFIFCISLIALQGCGGCGGNGGTQGGGTPASGDTSGAGPVGPVGPLGPAAAGTDLIWTAVNMADAQNREVLQPTAGVPVNIYGVMYNQGDTAAGNINATMKIKDVQVSGTDSLACGVGLYNRLSALNYVFNAPGDYKLSLDILSCNPPEVGAAAEPASNHYEKIIHVLAAGQAPPAPAAAAAGDIIVQSVIFVPGPVILGQAPVGVTQVNLGTTGGVGVSISNTFNQDVTFRLLITGGGNTLYDEPNFSWRANRQEIFWISDTPSPAGPYDIVATITPAAGTPAEEPGNNTANVTVNVVTPPPPPVNDIIAEKLNFYEDPSGNPVNQTTVGRGGLLCLRINNTFPNDVEINVKLTWGPTTICDGPPNSIPPGICWMNFNYWFPDAGQNDVVAEIRLVNPQVAENPGNNTASCPVLVGEAAGPANPPSTPPTATHVGAPNLPPAEVVPTTGPAVMSTDPTHPWTAERRKPKCDLEVTMPTFWGTGYHWGNTAEVGDTGNIKFNICNKSGEAAYGVMAKLVVTIEDPNDRNGPGRKWIDTSWPVDLPVGATIPVNIRISALPQVGSYAMHVEIDTLYKTNDTYRRNNTSDHGFTVMPAGYWHSETGTARSRLTADRGDSGSGEKMLKREVDAHATDIGFIPNSAKDYVDEVYQGEKGSLYGVFSNSSDADIKDLKVQILVDGRVIRDSVKPLLKAKESASFKFSNYWFNELGKHKVSLIVDPDNTIKELDEKNNRIGHTINVIPRPRPRTTTYDNSGAAAMSGLIGALGNKGNFGGGGSSSPVPPVYSPPTTYTQPSAPTAAPTPRVTAPVVDQGGGSSGSTAKKPTPTFTTKGLGK